MADQDAKPKASITNIYYDCLERIFDFLDLEDLLNVANTCKRLQIAAAAKFSDVYGKKRFCIRSKNFFNEENGIHVYHDDDDIVVVGSKFQLPLLRCFGANISHLDLDFSRCRETPSYTAILSQYINQYCADTLTTIAFHGNHLLSIEKPFKNVETLKIGFGDFGRIFSSFVNWYPNLRHLDMRHVNINTNHMAVNFPNLEYLDISIGQSTEYTVGFLNANLQLQGLGILLDDLYNTPHLATILNMIRGHQLILKLKVALRTNIQVSAAELAQLTNEHPSMVELNLPHYQFTAEDAIALIGQLNALKKFEFRVRDESECNRIRNELNGEWHFEHRQVNVGSSVYIIVLKRKH